MFEDTSDFERGGNFVRRPDNLTMAGRTINVYGADRLGKWKNSTCSVARDGEMGHTVGGKALCYVPNAGGEGSRWDFAVRGEASVGPIGYRYTGQIALDKLIKAEAANPPIKNP